MALRTPENQNHQSIDVIKHGLKSTLTSLSLKIQMAQKFISKDSLSVLQVEMAITLLSSTQKEISELSKKIEEIF